MTGSVRVVGYAGLTGVSSPEHLSPEGERLEQEVVMSEDRAHTANLLKAIEFASHKHSTQRRNDDAHQAFPRLHDCARLQAIVCRRVSLSRLRPTTRFERIDRASTSSYCRFDVHLTVDVH
jgi:hypothetical protein